jgi:hypothetical protein
MTPKMTDAERERFTRDVASLLKARWNTVHIADWAISAASGFGRFWESHKHALSVINEQCRAMNAELRRSRFEHTFSTLKKK